MPAPIFLYPSLTDEMKQSVFQAKCYSFSYVSSDGSEKELDTELSGFGSLVSCLKTDGEWNAEEHNLIVKRTVAVKNYGLLFGPNGLACRDARLGLSIIWTSPDSKQRGAEPILNFGFRDGQQSRTDEHSFCEGDVELVFPAARLREEVNFAVALYINKAGVPREDEMHLANEEGFVLGLFDSFSLRIDGTGSLFPVYEVYEKDKPLWYVRCDWTDPTIDQFSETVSINLNTAHKNYKYIDRTQQKTFCAQLLIEVLSSAICCIIEKTKAEQYLTQILGDDEMESGSVGEVIRYFANTLEWDFSSPAGLSLSTRLFFERRLANK